VRGVFQRRSIATGKGLESWHSVTLPRVSTLSVRIRKCVSATGPMRRVFSVSSLSRSAHCGACDMAGSLKDRLSQNRPPDPEPPKHHLPEV
jgi:hypothetical protein